MDEEERAQPETEIEVGTETPAPEPEAHTAEVKPEVAPPAPSPKPAADWREARIAKLAGQLREAKEALAAAAQPSGTTKDNTAELERIIEERASAKAAQQSFNDACNSAAVDGRKQFGDFDARVGALTQLVDRNDQASVQQYNQFLQAALETGAAPELIHRLGGDLNEAQRLLGLSPVRMAVELTKLATRPGPSVSAAPKPITPIGNRGASLEDVDPGDTSRADKLSTRAWMERREKQIADRGRAR